MMLEINENNEYVIVELDEEELEEVTGGKSVVSTGNGVHIRTGAGTKYPIIGKVKKGVRLTYAGSKKKDDYGNLWYKVYYQDALGWICGIYAKLVK